MTAPQRLDTDGFRDALDVALQWFELNREAVNAINVYPVPDGDTGTNMLLTLRAARRAPDEQEGAGDRIDAFTRALAQGALFGARGNSGVILSQMVRGLAEGLEGSPDMGPTELLAALDSAATAAYAAVATPVEGTMLTVMREAAAGATPDGEASLASVLDATVAAARASVARTPELLPQLRDAGVVDAGGEGVAVLLEGLRFGVTGEPLPPPPEAPVGMVQLEGVGHEGHGFCVEYLVTGEALDRDALAGELTAAGGSSLLVVGDPSTLHVHVHMEVADGAIEAGARFGEVQNVKVEDMQAQHDEWAAGHEEAAEAPPVGLVAVVQGDGLRIAFRDLGATAIVDGGATNNPSAGDVLEAALRAGTEHAFILPNDSNVVMTAQQAAAQEPGRITVVPAKSVAAGLAAAVAFVPGGDIESLAEGMAAAATAVRNVEVTEAVRDTTVDGVAVRIGDSIVLVDGTLQARTETPEEALMIGLADAIGDDGEIVTLILGADAPDGAAESLPPLIEAAHPDVEVEVVMGGQPHYPYLAGVE